MRHTIMNGGGYTLVAISAILGAITALLSLVAGVDWVGSYIFNIETTFSDWWGAAGRSGILTLVAVIITFIWALIDCGFDWLEKRSGDG